MSPEELAITIDSLWAGEIGKERLDQLLDLLIERTEWRTEEADSHL